MTDSRSPGTRWFQPWQETANVVIGFLVVVATGVGLGFTAAAVYFQAEQTKYQAEQTKAALDALKEDREERERNWKEREDERIAEDERRLEMLRLANLPHIEIPAQRTSIPLEVRGGIVRIADEKEWSNPRFIVNYGLGPAVDVMVSWSINEIRSSNGTSHPAACTLAKVSPINLMSGEAAKLVELPCFLEGLDPQMLPRITGSISIEWHDLRGERESAQQKFILTFGRSEDGQRTLALFDFQPIGKGPTPAQAVDAAPAPAPAPPLEYDLTPIRSRQNR